MYNMANMDKLASLGAAAPGAMAAFQALDKAALADGVIPKKYKELIALAVALTTQCPYCLRNLSTTMRRPVSWIRLGCLTAFGVG